VRICGKCFDLYETEHPSGNIQRCRCQAGDEPTWSGSDFNEHVHLCECCRTEVVTSGTKWSSFLCGECKARAVAVNERARATIVPFGRHSLMAREGMGLLDLVGAVDQIFAFGKEWLKSDLDVLDFPDDADVDLVAFLEAARASEKQEADLGDGGDYWGSAYRFGGLCYRLRAAAERIHGSSGRDLWRPYLAHLPIEMGLTRCEECGEYRGRAAKCLCQGVLCIGCKKRMAHRPISEFWDEAGGTFIHVAHFVPPLCAVCRKKAAARRT
jgi:hypothetical protein